MSGNICKAGCENLVEGIIVQAAEDFRRNYRILLENPSSPEASRRLESVKNFFLSDWYRQMTRVDGAYLMSALQKEVKESYQKKKANKLAKGTKNGMKSAETARIRSNR